ncbi:uncharacterized protein LOC132637700 [Lycium barbarum]|uniref:uncharacterized protein LOC132637700 n=1 Tax=Lycium barbarum TaxID=112863 RepID=UPI00293F78D1|nr:uncharacterized protein LOC132637700 [Lycium barbarum]
MVSKEGIMVDPKKIKAEKKVITYASRQLKIHEKNYPTYDLELAAVIKEKKFEDARLCKICDKVLSGEVKETMIDSEGILRIKGRICVPCVDDLIRTILEESHSSRYSIHPGATKMYHDLRRHYRWARMKHDIVEFVSQCLYCQQIKYEYQSPGDMLQGMPIPK